MSAVVYTGDMWRQLKNHELRIIDAGKAWRLVYRLDADAVVIADVFQNTTQQTPVRVIADCSRRLRLYDHVTRGD